MKDTQIAFIGAGNMAASIIGGLVDQGADPGAIRASDPSAQTRARLNEVAAVHTFASNAQAIAGAQVVILAVKPQVMRQVTADIREAVASQGALVISIAAGIALDSLEQGLGSDGAIVRCMPNTPALLRCGASALYANERVCAADKATAEAILAAVGTVTWVTEEKQLDAVTALSGSGPAYFFLFMEAMAAAGEKLGLPPETSRALTLQTGLGATRMAAESGVELAELRRQVTSPGGTTQSAIESFEASGLRDCVDAAMAAAAQRAVEMSVEMG